MATTQTNTYEWQCETLDDYNSIKSDVESLQEPHWDTVFDEPNLYIKVTYSEDLT